MTKKRKREEVSLDTKTLISQKLAEFNASTDKEYKFEANLSKAERKVVHIFCLKYGMKSRSSGNKDRCVTVQKKEKVDSTPQKRVDSTPQKKVSAISENNVNRNQRFQRARLNWRGERVPQNQRGQRDKKKKENENLTLLTFSEEGKAALQNLFMYYPPHEADMEKKMFGDHCRKTVRRRYTSDMFCKPSLTKEEITRKLKLVNRKRECDAKLRMITKMRDKLPIASFKDSIVSTVESNQIVLISGETGCGKTTQVPQYILDYMWGKGETCKVVCTQPRRISATSVAERVADERGEPIGEDIGYTIRLDKKGGKHSSIVFCTNGVLLQVLVSRGKDMGGNGPSDPYAKDNFSDLTHIIVDEIHERDRFSDFMLAILRDVLPLYPHLRLILMSATLDAERFSEYFGGCPIIRVPGFTYPVENFYLEDVLSILNSTDDKNLYSAALTVPAVASNLAEDKVISYLSVQKPSEVSKLSEEDRIALDEAINMAWSNDEFGPLLDLISSEGSTDFFNHQHSLTGLTPLMVFAGKGRVGDICMLLCFGVDCTLKAKDGATALELAERENQLGAADVIKRHMEGSLYMSASIKTHIQGSNRCENQLVAADIIKRPVEGSNNVKEQKLLDNRCENQLVAADIIKGPVEGSNNVEEQKLLDNRCENQLVASDIIKRPVEGSNNVEEQKLLDKYLESTNPILIDVVLIVRLLKKICNSSSEGAILIFLPGWDDITKVKDKLLADSFFADSSKFRILPLHSMVQAAEQKLVFERQKSGCRKIVISTNMAETSVTIDDVVYVIDSGRMKEQSYDPVCNVATLQTNWISKASAKQRAGRAGRCQPGICYHLYSKSREASLLDFQTPELKRVPVEELLLQIKMIDPDCNLTEFLNKTLDPPCDKAISNAVVFLQDVGAMTTGERLTEFGEKLGSLSVHPLVGRMLFFAVLMKCLDPALTLACARNFRDPFLMHTNVETKNKADQCKRELAALYGGHSDQLALVAAFDCFETAKEKGLGREFCTRFFLSFNTLRMLSGMRKKLQGELIAHGFVPEDISDYSVNARDPGILHAVLMAGSYPMVGRLRPPHNSARRSIFLSNGDRVRLHPKSMNAKLTCGESEFCPTFVFDEIVRGDSGTVIKKCTVIGPLPLLLFAKELAVAPGNDNDCVEDKNKKEDGMKVESKAGLENEEKIKNGKGDGMEVELTAGLKKEKINNRKEDGMEVDSKAGLESKNNKEDGMEVNLKIGLQREEKNKNKKDEGMEVESKAGLENEENVKDKKEDAMEKEEYKIMSSADKSVIVHVDRWLPYKSTALDVAMVYCLRDHLNASILFTATRPGRFLPPVLSAAASTIAFLLSRDGLNGAVQPLDPVAAPNPSGNVAEINENSTGKGTEVYGSSSAPAEKVMVDSPSDYRKSLLISEIKRSQRSSENSPAKPKWKKNTSLSGRPSQTSGSMPSQSTTVEPASDPSQRAKSKKKKKKKNTSLSGRPSQTSGSMPSQSTTVEPASDPSQRAKSKKKKKKKNTSLSGQPSQTAGSMPSQSSPGEPAGDPSQRANTCASKLDQKTSGKPATLVGYGASRFGPYGLRGGGTASAKRQRRVGARLW